MELSRPKEERKTKEHITPRNGDRHEKNEQQLDRTRKERPEQSGLENSGHWRIAALGVTGVILITYYSFFFTEIKFTTVRMQQIIGEYETFRNIIVLLLNS
ncbi:unnamed protein product [Schistosoma haematobium]|nr:unnamed protein product [Schistosoma haematobium]